MRGSDEDNTLVERARRVVPKAAPGPEEPRPADPPSTPPTTTSTAITPPASPASLAAGTDKRPAGAEDSSAPEPVDLKKWSAGHYEVIRQLGQGGMSQVFLARDTRLGRRVALKFLLKVDPHHYARFEVEARATAQLSHENIVALHDISAHGRRPYMVLEYVAGKTLSAWLRERRADRGRFAGVPAKRAAELMLPVARALQCAHEAGIVHRDLKPGNIMLADNGTIKVLDFGIAKLLDDAATNAPDAGAAAAAAAADDEAIADPLAAIDATTMTQAGTLLGTQAYMAPEQWRSEPVDGRADLWAIGVILYEMTTGEHPLGSHSADVLQRVAVLEEPMPKLAEKLPGLGELAELVDRCLIKPRADRLGSARELCEALEAIARPHLGARRDGEDELDPYAGLAAFQERDAASFFGRAAAVEQIVARLAEQPLLALVGSSGVGKSSLVRAGVIPALKHSGDAWEAFVLRPGPHPLAAVGELMLQHLGLRIRRDPSDAGGALGDHEATIERLRREPGFFGVVARSRSRRRRARTLLFIYLCVEFYTLASPGAREAFFACLAGAADDASSPLRVIIAIRHDFLDRIAGGSSALAELVSRSTVLVGSLDRRGLGRALIAPAESRSYRFESDALVTEILDALAAAATPLPILQFTATRLWEGRDRQRRLLTESCYRAFGGVGGALASHADSVLGALSSTERRHARALLLRLVTPERTRAVVTRRELSELGGDAAAELDRVIDRLIAARLLTVEGTDKDDSTVELLHESLIETWPTLSQWLAEAQGEARFLARLRSAAREWEAAGCDDGLLWRGEAEEEARRWLERQQQAGTAPGHREAAGLGVSERESRYLAAVVALGERERRRRRRIVAAVIAGLSVVVLAVSVLAVRSNRAAARAEAERIEAERSAASARNATRMAAARERQEDPTTVLALLREIEPGSTPRGWAEFARWAPTAGVASVVLLHEDGVWSVAFSPEGRRIAALPNDNTVHIWSADGSSPPLVLRGHTDQVRRIAWSPDGRRVVSASSDMTLRVWSADGAGEPLVLRGHEDRVYSAEFSPDGRHIVSAARDKTVRVWNADGSGRPVVLRGHDERVYGAAWSPDGRRIVSASRDKTVRVWNADGSGEPLVLRGHTEAVSWAAFSPDGRRIVSSSYDTTMRVWNADGSGEPLVLRGHEANVFFAAWSPDGRRIVSASQDKTLRIWSADGAGSPLIFTGHRDIVYEVAWSPDGRHVVSASLDKTVRVWSADRRGPPVLRGHDAPVFTASFSPDGTRIVSGSFDRTIRVWNADGTGEPLVLRGHGDRIYAASFSPDGTRIVSASFDKTIRVWNADGTGEPLVLRGHDERVYSAAFSRDGRRIVSASNDKTVRVWNADGTGTPLVLRGHDVYVAAFSPDGRRIVSAAFDKTLQVWNADGTGEPRVLRGHDDRLYAAAFSPDGRRIASSSNDKTVRVWDADGAAPPLVLEGHDAAVTGVAWSPDGTRLVSSSKDSTVRIWNADGTGEPLVLHTKDEMNMASWSPDGTRIVGASEDKTLTVWSDLVPLQSADDPKLWTATSYCMPLVIRQQLLGFSEQQHRSDLERCRLRVRRFRETAAPGR